MDVDRRATRAHRIRRQRQRAAGATALVVLVVTGSCWCRATVARPPRRRRGRPPRPVHTHRRRQGAAPLLPRSGRWGPPVTAPIVRTAVHRGRRRSLAAGQPAVPRGGGGQRHRADRARRHHPSGTSLPTVSTVDPAAGAVTPTAGLADPSTTPPRRPSGGPPRLRRRLAEHRRHRPGASRPRPSLRPPGRTGTVVGQLPQPRSDLAVATVSSGRGPRPPPRPTWWAGTTAPPTCPGCSPPPTAPTSPRWPTCPSRCATRRWWPTAAPLRLRRRDRLGRLHHHGHRRHPADRPGHPPGHGRRPPAPAPLRRGRLRHRRDHLRGRRPGPGRSHPHPDLRLRAVDGQGARTPGSSPRPRPSPATPPSGRAARHRVHRGRRGRRPRAAPTRPAWPRAPSGR